MEDEHRPSVFRLEGSAPTVRGRARTVAIASGKGGVGKTCLAVAIAATLARDGARVLLVDGDLGLANVDVQLGLTPEFDLGDLVAGTRDLAGAVTRCPAGAFDLLAGRAGSGALASLGAADLESLLLILSRETRYDVVLIDLGAGIDRAVRRMACWADTLLVVATDEPTSLTDAYVVVKLHVQDKRRLAAAARARIDTRFVINQAVSPGSGQRTYAALAKVCAAYLDYSPACGGIVRRDERMRDAIRNQVPLPLRYPLSPAACDVERLARSLRDDAHAMDEAL